MVTKRSGFIQALLASLKALGHCQDWGFGAVGIAIFNPILLDNSQAPNASGITRLTGRRRAQQ
jgi:hypothetical protein